MLTLDKDKDILIIDNSAVVKKFEKLVAHDASVKGAWACEVVQLMDSMKFNDVLNLSLKDFLRIHKEILKKVLTNLDEHDKHFVNIYGSEVYDYKSMSPLFKNKLFLCDIHELNEAIRSKNKALKKTLFSIEKK